MGKLTLNEIKKILGVDENSLTAKVAVTPESATKILKMANKKNRRINKSYVESLKRDMENGNWYSDIDYIGFDSKGFLVNGQHRLKALSISNIEKLTLKFDFDTEQHISMDTGNNRKYSSQVNLSKKNGVSIMPSKFKSIILTGIKLSNPNEKIVLSNSELMNIWEKYGDKITICDENGLFNLGSKAGTSVKSSLLWAYLSGVGIRTLKHFAEVLRTGITRSEYDIPIIRLRDELVDIRGNGKNLDLRRAAYTQQCIFNVLQESTSNRLPSNPIMHYQNFDILK